MESRSMINIFLLKNLGHTDAATIAQWKDALNDAWADLGELIDTRTQMLEASRELHKYFHEAKLHDTNDLFRFFAMVRNLVLWMDDLMRQMKTSEKPRDVSGVELLMNNHQVKTSSADRYLTRPTSFSVFSIVNICSHTSLECLTQRLHSFLYSIDY